MQGNFVKLCKDRVFSKGYVCFANDNARYAHAHQFEDHDAKDEDTYRP